MQNINFTVIYYTDCTLTGQISSDNKIEDVFFSKFSVELKITTQSILQNGSDLHFKFHNIIKSPFYDHPT